MSELPTKITTRRVKTRLELARDAVSRLRIAMICLSDRDGLDIYDAVISGDAPGLGKLILKVDNDY